MTVQVRESIAGKGWDEDAAKPLFCVRVYLGERADADVSRLPYYKQVQAVIHFPLWYMGEGWFCGGDYINKQDAEDMAEKVRSLRRKSKVREAHRC
jgi:hypothetical protein